MIILPVSDCNCILSFIRPLTEKQVEKIKMVLRENLVSHEDIKSIIKGLPKIKLPEMVLT